MNPTTNQKRIDELFNELVPESGKAETRAGEIIRAIGRIGYRYFNDGDRIGIGYGNETCNAAARFLRRKTNAQISDIIDQMWGKALNDNQYEALLEELNGAVADFIENNPDLKTKLNPEDMWDYRDESDYHYDDELEDDGEWE